MTGLIKNNIAGLLLILIIAATGSYSCSGAAPSAIPPVSQPASPPAAAIPVQPPVPTAPVDPVKSTNRVDVIYFHTPQRCASCICFQEHVTSVINTYFKNELANGKLTFQVINTTDQSKAAVTKQYKAMGTQLFINTIRAGVDEIADIQDIWSWKCLTDVKGFETKVKSLIEVKLKDSGGL
jgi:hypothetical protein